ncbi:hypothetical protein HN371_29945 [Candidatus Poribacteria bacterium]|nr:hypothetical protein [Candidatus Poribacteria bacterium]MBT5535300.1 hypothetical protein [Candidatus Poribacteria bacterium]MBT5715156.1 hypothetical protein [Candidatus Poribacteria bacterium]MBT7097687.1 hypothetical protein [Candidatus Poribacteria bacterium]MBT7807383.1 hypothetical protein [Candidatus Poribacteria bacterium]
MAAVTREQLHAIIDDLTEGHLEDAREALSRISEQVDRRALDQQLLAAGVLVSVPPPITDEFRREFRELTRLDIPDEPVSQTIIEDRRARG